MAFIFLDIDGVLVTEETSNMPNHELYATPFDAGCVAVLNEILVQTGADIILSSDWKLMYPELQILDEIFKYNGVIKSPIDVTPNMGKNRTKEIEYYINTSNISSFVIIDDYDLRIFPDKFVRCNLHEGIKKVGIKEKTLAILTGS